MSLLRRGLPLILSLTLALAGATSARAQAALDEIQKTKTIRIAIPTDFPPYGSIGADMQPQGLDIDIARLIASKMGVKAELIPTTTANRVPYLQTHRADLVISTLGKNAELTKVAPASTEVRRFEDNNSTISAFVAGQTQLVATSAQVAAVMMEKNPKLGTELKFVLKESPNFVGVAKGEDALKAKVNEIIAQAKADGTLDAISKKWLGKPTGDLPL